MIILGPPVLGPGTGPVPPVPPVAPVPPEPDLVIRASSDEDVGGETGGVDAGGGEVTRSRNAVNDLSVWWEGQGLAAHFAAVDSNIVPTGLLLWCLGLALLTHVAHL